MGVVIIVAHHKNSPARQCRRTSTVLSTPSSSFRQRVSFCHPCRLLHRQPRLHGIVYLIRRVVVLFDLFPLVRDARGDFGQKESCHFVLSHLLRWSFCWVWIWPVLMGS